MSPDPLFLSQHSVLAVWRPREEADGQRAIATLRRWYEPALGRLHASWRSTDLGVVVLVLSPDPLPDSLPDTIVWGTPLPRRRPPGPPVAVVDDPRAGRNLLGSWVVAGDHGHGVRLVSSSDLSATLRRVDGPLGTTVATKGATALLLAGIEPRPDNAHVAEYVMFDYVLGADELLAEVSVLPEASTVDVGPSYVAVSSYWPISERFTPIERPTTASFLRRRLKESLDAVDVDDPVLSLTAGRDSLLVASCFKELGRNVTALTMGSETMADGAGARAVSRRLGWPHEWARLDAHRARPDFSGAVSMSRWTEGLQTISDHLEPTLVWPAKDPRGRLLVTGSGGEIGRGFYYPASGSSGEPIERLIAWRASHLDDERSRCFRQRVEVGMSATVAEAPQTGIEILDVLYARGRMRKWLAGVALPPGFWARSAAFTDPRTVRTLLSIPVGYRRDATVFDEALAMDPYDLRTVALEAAQGVPEMPDLRTVADRIRQAVSRGPSDPRLRQVLGQIGSKPAIREILGDTWWRTTTMRASESPIHARWLWNALSVEALTRSCDEWRQGPRANQRPRA